MYEMLRAKNSGLKKDVVEFTKKLVNTPSVSLKEENVALLVEKEMKNNGFDKVFPRQSRQCNWHNFWKRSRSKCSFNFPYGYGSCK